MCTYARRRVICVCHLCACAWHERVCAAPPAPNCTCASAALSGFTNKFSSTCVVWCVWARLCVGCGVREVLLRAQCAWDSTDGQPGHAEIANASIHTRAARTCDTFPAHPTHTTADVHACSDFPHFVVLWHRECTHLQPERVVPLRAPEARHHYLAGLHAHAPLAALWPPQRARGWAGALRTHLHLPSTRTHPHLKHKHPSEASGGAVGGRCTSWSVCADLCLV